MYTFSGVNDDGTYEYSCFHDTFIGTQNHINQLIDTQNNVITERDELEREGSAALRRALASVAPASPRGQGDNNDNDDYEGDSEDHEESDNDNEQDNEYDDDKEYEGIENNDDEFDE